MDAQGLLHAPEIRKEVPKMTRELIPWRRSRGLGRGRGLGLGEPSTLALRSEMDRLFGGFFGQGLRAFEELPNVMPVRVDVREDDKAMIVAAELPGIDEEDIEVTLVGDMLTIRGEKKDEREESDENVVRRERV